MHIYTNVCIGRETDRKKAFVNLQTHPKMKFSESEKKLGHSSFSLKLHLNHLFGLNMTILFSQMNWVLMKKKYEFLALDHNLESTLSTSTKKSLNYVCRNFKDIMYFHKYNKI